MVESITKLRYKIAKVSRMFASTGNKIEVNGDFFTVAEYLESTVKLVEMDVK